MRAKNGEPLPKLATGIEGFDELSRGGLPRHRTSLLIGGPGAGKTVFALQCLVNGARRHRAPAASCRCYTKMERSGKREGRRETSPQKEKTA
jgi:predicted ATP-dependent serine protease